MRAQNATIIFTRRPLGVVVQCFEVSAANSAVMSAVALRRTFPERVVILPLEVIRNPDFMKELTNALEQLYSEDVAALRPQTRKAGSSTAEQRDTVTPGLITVMIMGILSAYGFTTTVQYIGKRIRDDV